LRANRKLELDLVLVIQDEPGTKRFAVPRPEAREYFPGPTFLD
jgi:hypothetical protein